MSAVTLSAIRAMLVFGNPLRGGLTQVKPPSLETKNLLSSTAYTVSVLEGLNSTSKKSPAFNCVQLLPPSAVMYNAKEVAAIMVSG